MRSDSPPPPKVTQLRKGGKARTGDGAQIPSTGFIEAPHDFLRRSVCHTYTQGPRSKSWVKAPWETPKGHFFSEMGSSGKVAAEGERLPEQGAGHGPKLPHV